MADKIAIGGVNSGEMYAEVQSQDTAALMATLKAIALVAEKYESGEKLFVEVVPINALSGGQNGGN